MKVISEFSLADSTGNGKKNTGSRGRYYVRVSLVVSLSTPRESRGGNVEFSLVGIPVTCAVQIEILVSLAGIYHDRSAVWSLDLISPSLSICFSDTRVFIGRARMPLADIIEELRRISRWLYWAQSPIIHWWNSRFFFFFFLHSWIVNNAQCSASIHHDETLQMNINNSSCLFFTIIY